MKTKAQLTASHPDDLFRSGQTGYVDGYVVIGSDVHAVVVIGRSFQVVPIGWISVESL